MEEKDLTQRRGARGGLGVVSKLNVSFVLFLYIKMKKIGEGNAHIGNNAPSSASSAPPREEFLLDINIKLWYVSIYRSNIFNAGRESLKGAYYGKKNPYAYLPYRRRDA